jgi:hypothetical protein
MNEAQERVIAVHTDDNLLANSKAVVTEIFLHPLSISTVDHPARLPPPPPPPSSQIFHDLHLIRVDPKFKMIFIAVCGFTAVTLLLDVVFSSYFTEPTKTQMALLDHLGTAWAGGVGTIIGLVGGKSL